MKRTEAKKSGAGRVAAAGFAVKTARYRAPALEDRLDVLELLATRKSPRNLSTISQRLGWGKLFRMLQMLEFRGSITTADNESSHVLTNESFAYQSDDALRARGHHEAGSDFAARQISNEIVHGDLP